MVKSDYTQADLEKDRKELGYPHVITAYAEPASGPGWGNAPLWVVMQDISPDSKTGYRYYIECIQPEDQTEAIRTMYVVSAQAHGVMRGEAEKILIKRGLCNPGKRH